MKKDDINHIAVVAGFPERRAFSDLSDLYPRLERFAELVRAEEREACAKLCESYRDEWLKGLGRYEFMGEGADFLADFIRARGQS